MELREYIATVGATFDRSAPMSAPAQVLLRRASDELKDVTPVGFQVTGSGGAGNPATIPWFGFLDPEETTTPLEGLYVVYLFNAPLDAVTLTLIQGITRLHDRVHPPAAARALLRADGEGIRNELGDAHLAVYDATIDLGAAGRLPSGYEAGAVAALRYELSSLPDQASLADDLVGMFELYQDAIQAKRALLLSSPGAISTPSGSGPTAGDESTFDHFKPKDSGDYTAHVTGGTFTRTRRHEALIRDYGEAMRVKGLKVSTAEHPQDMVIRFDGHVWLIEGEVLRRGNAAHAVREAIGQLFEYRRFLYTNMGQAQPGLVGLFSEPIGDAFVELLDELGIEAVWREGAGWAGSSGASSAGLTRRPT